MTDTLKIRLFFQYKLQSEINPARNNNAALGEEIANKKKPLHFWLKRFRDVKKMLKADPSAISQVLA